MFYLVATSSDSFYFLFETWLHHVCQACLKPEQPVHRPGTKDWQGEFFIENNYTRIFPVTLSDPLSNAFSVATNMHALSLIHLNITFPPGAWALPRVCMTVLFLPSISSNTLLPTPLPSLSLPLYFPFPTFFPLPPSSSSLSFPILPRPPPPGTLSLFFSFLPLSVPPLCLCFKFYKNFSFHKQILTLLHTHSPRNSFHQQTVLATLEQSAPWATLTQRPFPPPHI